MSCRKASYLIGVILLGFITTIPHALLFFCLGWDTYHSGSFLPIPGMGRTIRYSHRLFWGEVWQGRSFMVGRTGQNGIFLWRCDGIDPLLGPYPDLGFELPRFSNPEMMPFGDRLWISDGVTNGKVSEVVDGKLQESSFIFPPGLPNRRQSFVLNDKPALIMKASKGFAVTTINTGNWVNSFDVVLPDLDRDWTFGTTQVNFGRASELTCFSHGDRIHLFLEVDGCILHREGIDLKPVASTGEPTADPRSLDQNSPSDLVSTPIAANTDGSIMGWSLVSDVKQIVVASSESVPDPLLDSVMLVQGEPVASIVISPGPGQKVAYLYRFDGSHWSPLAIQTFPFGTDQLRTFSGRDRQSSCVVALTALGTATVYVVDSHGIQVKAGAASTTRPGAQTSILSMLLSVILAAEIFKCLGIWLLMSWYTRPEYQYRNQFTTLASLRQRGFARLIDLVLIISSMAGIAWGMMRGFDWPSFAEALNLHVEHPTTRLAFRMTMLLGFWLIAVTLAMVAVQGWWGITPGKWSCGLRVVRTSLAPCGFARSLVREIVMCIDTCDLLCWTPGILSIALTNFRQRLGDLVADTLVVEAHSIQLPTQNSEIG